MILTEDEIRQAWARIGASKDGAIARHGLVAILMAGPPQGSEDGALREWAGRTRFAREVLTLMDSTNAAHGRPTDDPAVRIARPEPSRPAARGAGRRVEPDPSYDDPA